MFLVNLASRENDHVLPQFSSRFHGSVYLVNGMLTVAGFLGEAKRSK